MTCQNESCGSKFHLACAQSSGCFFSHTQSAFLCPQHLDSVVSMRKFNEMFSVTSMNSFKL